MQLINVKMPSIVGILTIISRINFVLSCVEYEKNSMTSGLFLTRSYTNQPAQPQRIARGLKFLILKHEMLDYLAGQLRAIPEKNTWGVGGKKALFFLPHHPWN